MKDSTVAGRYARALDLLLQRQAPKLGVPLVGMLERALDELRTLAGLVGHGTRLGDFLASPQVPPADKRALLKRGLEGRASQGVVVFADLLLRKKRLVLAGQIAREFQAIVEKAQGVQRATVFSAVALTDAEQKRLHGELERTTGKKIVLSAEIDESLVGGAYVRIGDRVVDRSVKSLLQAIAKQLYEVSV